MKKGHKVAVGCIGLLLAVGVFAEEEEMGWITELVSGSPVQIISSEQQPVYQTAFTVPEAPVQQAMSAGAQPSTQPISSDVDEMAAALEYDPVQIYEFVRNDIAYDHQWGWLRSPERTLVDRMGSDMDQAALLVDLLHVSGYTNAGYARAYVTLPPSGNDGYNLNGWLGAFGLDTAGNMMDAAGTPYYIYTNSNVLIFYHFWVTVTIDGEDYDLDPSMTPHEYFGAKDLYDMSGYSRSNLLAFAGGSSSTNGVSGLDEDALRTHLGSLTTNLIHTVRSDCPNGSVSDVLGGKKIVPEQGLGALQVGTPYTINYGDTMPEYLHYIHFVDAPYMPLLATRDLGCETLTVEMGSDGTGGTIFRDDSMIYLGAVAQAGGACRVEYIRPDNYDDSGWQFFWNHNPQIYSLETNSVNAFSYNLGDSDGTGIFKKNTDGLHESLASGASDDSLKRTSLHTIGSRWMTQKALVENIMAELFQDDFVRSKRYSLGLFAEDFTGYHVDIPHLYISAFADSTLSSEALWAIYRAPYFLTSAAEHGVLEQSQPDAEAVSTIELLTLASRDTQTVFRVTSNNWSSVEPVLTNYSASILQDLEDSVLTNGHTVILPQDAAISMNSWTGLGYITFSEGSIGFIINGGFNGGYNSTDDPLDVDALSLMLLDAGYSPVEIVHMLSIEPVDMTTGAYIFDRDDLRIDGPLGLALSRHYSSQQRNVLTPMGYGWTHSFDISVREHSAPQMGLGLRSPEDVASTALGLCVIKDLLEHEDTAKGWLTATLTARWVTDQLTDNAVTITMGQKAVTFIKQPDGSYTPPPGMTVSLIQTNGVYVMQERNASTYTFSTNNLITGIEDPDGNTLTFAYNAQTNLQTVTSSFGPTMTLSYTGDELTSVSDSTGRGVEYEYDSSGNLINFVDAENFEWGVAYGDTNLPHCITALTDPEGVTTIQNFYNSAAQVTNQISATDNPWNFYFTGTRNVEEDPYGNQTAYHIDGQGRTWSVEDALSNRTYAAYDGQNHATNTVDARGVTNLFVYDVDHNLLSRTDAVGTPEERTTEYGYDSLHRLEAITNALDVVTEFTYTGTHHIDTITEAVGSTEERETDFDYFSTGLLDTKTEGDGLRVTEYTYDSNGNLDLLSSTDAGDVDHLFDAQGDLKEVEIDGVTTEYDYDDRRLLTTTTYASGASDEVSESRTYWDNELLKTATDARNETTRYSWTPAYKQAGIVLPNTGSTTNLYDDADRLVATRDPEGNWITNNLDAVGRPLYVSSVYSVVENSYDPAGNLTNSTIDPSGLNLWTATEFDTLNRPASASSALSAETFQYDDLSRMTNRVDGVSKHWKTEHDALSRVEKTFRPSENYEEFGYDALGNRTSFWNAEGKQMTFGVDAHGRVTAITNAIGKMTSYTYDDAGNLTDREDAKAQRTEYGYDSLNRLTSITNEGVWKASFDHDENGSITLISNPVSRISMGYDEMNRLSSSTSLVDSVNFVVNHSYDLNGNRTNIVCPGSKSVGYTYDEENRLKSIDLSDFGLSDFDFYYDGAGRLTNIAYPNGIDATIGYDTESRVTSYEHGTVLHHGIQRDGRGFKTTEDIYEGLLPTFANELRQSRVYNDADQLLSAGTNTYSYDDNGCMTNASGTEYFWDYNNRLTDVGGTEYIYDASGARIGRIHGSATNYFIIDYADGLKRPLAETDASGTVTRYYVWAGYSLVAHIEAGGTVRYYHQDELGSTLALSDSTGSVTDRFSYAPYGEMLSRTGTNETAFLWLGGYGVYYDEDTDLHLTLHRAYSPSMKRFISADPLGIDGGVNVYMWANLNPLFFVDPYGLEAQKTFGEKYKDFVDYTLDAWWNPFYWGERIANNPNYGPLVFAAPALAAPEMIVASTTELAIFAKGGASWHLGLETAGNMNIIHVGNHIKHGVHIAIGAVAPYVADVHIYLQNTVPFYRVWRPGP